MCKRGNSEKAACHESLMKFYKMTKWQTALNSVLINPGEVVRGKFRFPSTQQTSLKTSSFSVLFLHSLALFPHLKGSKKRKKLS